MQPLLISLLHHYSCFPVSYRTASSAFLHYIQSKYRLRLFIPAFPMPARISPRTRQKKKEIRFSVDSEAIDARNGRWKRSEGPRLFFASQLLLRLLQALLITLMILHISQYFYSLFTNYLNVLLRSYRLVRPIITANCTTF